MKLLHCTWLPSTHMQIESKVDHADTMCHTSPQLLAHRGPTWRAPLVIDVLKSLPIMRNVRPLFDETSPSISLCHLPGRPCVPLVAAPTYSRLGTRWLLRGASVQHPFFCCVALGATPQSMIP